MLPAKWSREASQAARKSVGGTICRGAAVVWDELYRYHEA